MNYFTRVSSITSILIIFLSLVACGPKSLIVKDHAITADVSGLELDKSQEPTILYVRPGVPDLGTYDRFIIDPVNVIYTDSKMQELSPEQVGKMQQYFRDAMIKELREAGYEVGTRSQANTMKISLTISGLKAPKGGGAANIAAMTVGTVVGLPMIWSVSVGEVTVEGVFREALSNRIDAIAVGRARGSRTLNKKPWSTWADVEATFDEWAKGVRESVDKAHGK